MRDLCALPPSWLLELLCCVDAPSRIALFRCCASVRELSTSSFLSACTFCLQPARFLDNIRLLREANKLCSRVHLVLDTDGLLPEQAGHALGALLRHAATQEGEQEPGRLSSVIQVTIQGPVVLKQLVPSFLLLCDRLEQLNLLGVSLHHLPGTVPAQAQPAQFHNLTTLRLEDVSTTGLMRTALLDQVRLLPNLQNLSICRPTSSLLGEELDHWGCWLSLPGVLAPQLTHLTLQGADLPERITSDRAVLKTILPPGTTFPNLTTLSLDIHVFSAEAVQHLLQCAPNLTLLSVIGVWLEPTVSLTDVPCSWRHLHLQEVCVEQLARLPLQQVEQLVVAGSVIRVSRLGVGVDTDLNLTQSAVQRVKAMGGFKRKRELANQELQVYCGQDSCPELLTNTLPLLLGLECSGLVITEARPLVRSNIQGLEQHVISPNLTLLSCSWEPDAWACMPLLSTCLQQLSLHSCDVSVDMLEVLIHGLGEQLQAQQRDTGQEPAFTLNLRKDEMDLLSNDWEDRLDKVLAAQPAVKLVMQQAGAHHPAE